MRKTTTFATAIITATNYVRATTAATTTAPRRYHYAAIIGPATTSNNNASSIVVGSCPYALGVMAGQRPFSTRPAEQRSDEGGNESGGASGGDGAVGVAQGSGELPEMKPWDPKEKRTGVLAMKVRLFSVVLDERLCFSVKSRLCACSLQGYLQISR